MQKKDLNILFRVDIVIESDGHEFHAFCPTLKGLHTSGKNEGEALENAKNAAIAYVESLIKHGEPIPLSCIVREKVERKSKTNHFTENISIPAFA